MIWSHNLLAKNSHIKHLFGGVEPVIEIPNLCPIYALTMQTTENYPHLQTHEQQYNPT